MTDVYHASTSRQREWSGPKRWIRIVVHDTLRQFYDGAKNYSDNANWEGAVGAFHPSAHREKFDKKTQSWVPVSDPYFAGVMRLCKEELDIEVVVHECVHAGLAIYRADVKPRVNLKDEVNPDEEHLCYIIGDITEAVFAAFEENK